MWKNRMIDSKENTMKINEKQLELVNAQVQRLIASDNFYGKKLKESGIGQVKTEEDFVNFLFPRSRI